MPKATTRTLLREGDGGLVRRTVLPGGLRVITEQVPGVRSVSFGVWVGVGSRDETAAQMGSAHYLEHLLFKGTNTRSALEISASIEAVGGDLNAFTTKEYTCFYARVLDTDLPLAVAVVSDVVTDALILAADVEAERGVILEEIAMHDDDPSDIVHDEFAAALLGDTPLGRPILGTVETIEAIPRAAINRFYRSRYRPESMVVAAAGNLDHATVVAQVREAFAHVLDPSAEVAAPRRKGRPRAHGASIRVVERATEQAHLVLGVPGFTRSDDRRYALAVLTTAFGGGMSSRLFQEIREKRGLAYSVYAYSQGFSDDGMFGLYVGCLPGKVHKVLEVCREQMELLAESGLSEEEIARGKGQVRGGTVLGQEDTGARMTRIAKSELHDDPLLSIDRLLRKVDAVTSAEIKTIAATLLDAEPTLAIIGPFADASNFEI
ncbi:MAG: pitrilysin family protein [Actinobacteria bacterium]|jgi:predicted Zn-dependent peptidase|nr:pitrilysin family protein [Actinomycetota bacterium]